MLSQSLDDLGTTLGECLERTRWSSSLDCTTYLYYFYKWLYTTSLRSHVLSRMFYNHMTCHMIWLHKFPCYLYLVFIEWLDICDQVFECAGNFFLLRALITPENPFFFVMELLQGQADVEGAGVQKCAAIVTFSAEVWGTKELGMCLSRRCVTNFIRPYLHQFFIDSHSLNGYGKPLKRPFDRY